MKKALKLLENNVDISDKTIIERLKNQLEQYQNLNSQLIKEIDNQKKIIKNQELIFNFLNDWKFMDKDKQTNLKETCKN